MEIKEEVQVVYEEDVALLLTSGQHEDPPRRRLTDFRFYDAGGQPQLIEMSTVDDLLIAGLILPLEDSSDKQNQNCVRCVGFGPIESWSISGYKDGSPAIWVSTEAADYDCIKPAVNYKKFYNQFFEKAQACVEIYRKLSKSSGGNPDLSLDELLASVVQTISASKGCPSRGSIKDFIISHGEFIHGQLISLEGTSNQNDKTFSKLPVLVALRDEGYKRRDFTRAKAAYFGGSYMSDLGIIDAENEVDESGSSIYASQENNDLKLARLLQEEEYLKSISPEKIQGSAPLSDKYYIKINEDEIANDYPLPAYYKTSNEETDEFLFFDSDIHMCDTDELPRSMLQNWSLYNSDSRLISLELLPMKPCAHIDVTMFGSGVMTGDDGSGFCLDTDLSHSSSSNQGPRDVDGFPIYLSAIKEWTIDFGSSMIFISIRTDMAWYCLFMLLPINTSGNFFVVGFSFFFFFFKSSFAFIVNC